MPNREFRVTRDGATAIDDWVEASLVWLAGHIGRIAIAMVLVWLACSGAYMVIEHTGPVQALWWGLVTASTTGYGDTYPESVAGRGIAAFLMVSMVWVLLPLWTASIASRLIVNHDAFTHEEQEALRTRLDEVLTEVRELRRERADEPGPAS
jgi:voltage-gated potassium channel